VPKDERAGLAHNYLHHVGGGLWSVTFPNFSGGRAADDEIAISSL
jgi:hypothetical protein